MKRIYEIVTIQPAEAPPAVENSNWYRYVIAFGGTDTIHGCRQGSLKAVTSAVDEIIVQLNERHTTKRGKEKKPKSRDVWVLPKPLRVLNAILQPEGIGALR